MPACKPNSGSSARSADSTNPATAAASMTTGAARTALIRPPRGANSWVALVTRRNTASGSSVSTKNSGADDEGARSRASR